MDRGRDTARGRDARAGRDERGETLALLVVWPALITAILLMLVHAFIVANAQAEAEVAASEGLRAAWRAAADSDFLDDPASPGSLYTGNDPHPEVAGMAVAVDAAAARAAATEQGWRWWTPEAAQVYSDWCHPFATRPAGDETGWVRVVVSGDVFGPLAALWPTRWDTVYAAAQGPVVLVAPDQPGDVAVPADLGAC